jgi:hypothetical protein
MGDLILLRSRESPCRKRHAEYHRHLYGLLDQPVLHENAEEDTEAELSANKRRIRLFKPDCVSPDMIHELHNVFADRPDIYRIHVLLACHPTDDIPHWLILIDFDGERTSVFPAVVKTVSRYIKPGDSFEVMQADDYMQRSADRCTTPIFHKLHILN